jgi:hypothetical protein
MRTFWLLGALGALAGCGGGDHADKTTVCSLAGCTSGFAVSAPHVTTDHLQILASTLTACRNGSCLTHPLADWDGRSGQQIYEEGHADWILLGIIEEGATTHFEIDYLVPKRDGERLPDGDSYDITLAAGDTKLIDVHHAASYRMFQPNGPDCAPTCWNDWVMQ